MTGTFDAVGFQAAVEAIQVTSEHRDFWAAFAAWYPSGVAFVVGCPLPLGQDIWKAVR